jgi:hypothetical protein
MQDEARHVAYGTMHLRYRLARDPSLAADYHAYLDRGEEIISMLFTTPEVVEPTAILAAGGVKQAEELAMGAADVVRGGVVQEYLERCEHAGLPRWDRVTLPAEMLTGVVGLTHQEVH